jgi:hypothetical protein
MSSPDAVPGATEQLLDGQPTNSAGQIGEGQPAAGLVDANGIGI